MEINFITQIWQEGKMFVGYAPQLDISSCGRIIPEAKKNLQEAVNILIEELAKNY